MLVAIDAGHGGSDTGAVGPNGTAESRITLEVASTLERMFNRCGIRTVMTRANNTAVSLGTRCKYANDAGADCFVSIHCNSDGPDAMGCEVWTSPGDTAADPLATVVLGGIQSRLPGLPYRKDLSDGDPDKEAGFYVLRKTKMPAVLVELAFISNPDEELMLQKREVQVLYCEGIAWGVVQWLRTRMKAEGGRMNRAAEAGTPERRLTAAGDDNTPARDAGR